MTKKQLQLDPALSAVTMKYIDAWVKSELKSRTTEREFLLRPTRRKKAVR